jgi:hypothetical protein
VPQWAGKAMEEKISVTVLHDTDIPREIGSCAIIKEEKVNFIFTYWYSVCSWDPRSYNFG